MSYQHTLRKPDGYARILTEQGVEEFDTQQCVHCNQIFHMVKGSGTTRGFCLKCMGVTCGSKPCDVCIPFEAQLEHMEGKTTAYTPLIVDQFGRAI